MRKIFNILKTFVHGGIFGMCAEYLYRVEFHWIPLVICLVMIIDLLVNILVSNYKKEYDVLLDDIHINQEEELYSDFDLDEVTRVELIDDKGRQYSNWKVGDLDLQLQDDKRTLKIFIKNVIIGTKGQQTEKIIKVVPSIPAFKCYEINTIQARMYGCDKQCEECKKAQQHKEITNE